MGFVNVVKVTTQNTVADMKTKSIGEKRCDYLCDERGKGKEKNKKMKLSEVIEEWWNGNNKISKHLNVKSIVRWHEKMKCSVVKWRFENREKKKWNDEVKSMTDEEIESSVSSSRLIRTKVK